MSKSKVNEKMIMNSSLSQDYKKYIFLLKGDLFLDVKNNDQQKTPEIISLKNPHTRISSLYLIDVNDSVIYEIQKFSDEPRSYFVNDDIISDGSFYISTPIDPLFLLIPYFKKSTYFSPLDQFLKDDCYPEVVRLLACTGLKYINHISDKKDKDDLIAYKYNEEKTLIWLEKKIQRIVEVLRLKKIHVGNSSVVSANYVSDSIQDDKNENYLRYAHGILSQYLDDELSKTLYSFLKLPDEQEISKRKELSNKITNDNNAKKVKIDNDTATDNSIIKLQNKVTAKPLILSAKDKARAKASSGTKSITTFFTKK